VFSLVEENGKDNFLLFRLCKLHRLSTLKSSFVILFLPRVARAGASLFILSSIDIE